MKSSAIDVKTKSELLQSLAAVSSEATLGEKDRRPAVVRPLSLQIGKYLAGAKVLVDLWNAAKPLLAGHFGISGIEV